MGILKVIRPTVSAYPNQVLIIDILAMPRGHSGKTSVLTCIDKFSGYLVYYALNSGSSDCIVEALTRHFLTFGPPECIESDAGANLLKSSPVLELCSHFSVATRVSVGYHHEAIGALERRHFYVKRRLRAVSDSRGAGWEQRLQGVVYSLNIEVCDTHGHSPFFLFFLRHPNSSLSKLATLHGNRYSHDYVHEKLRLRSATLREAQAQRSVSQRRCKQQYNRRHRVKDFCYRSGDQLFVRNFRIRSKMDDPWHGPFVVVSGVGRRHVDYIPAFAGVFRHPRLAGEGR